jgi:hypothetical protein
MTSLFLSNPNIAFTGLGTNTEEAYDISIPFSNSFASTELFPSNLPLPKRYRKKAEDVEDIVLGRGHF